MLLLGITGSTTLYTQLTSTLTQSYYTWALQDKTTGITYSFYQNDSSIIPYYNEFVITNNGSLGLTAGMVQLPASIYDYTVYEMVSAYDLNISDSVSIAGNGILSIAGTYSQAPIYTGGSFTQSAYTNISR